MEKAFVGPYRLAERLGVSRLEAAAIAAHDADAFVQIFATVLRISGILYLLRRSMPRRAGDFLVLHKAF